MSEKAVLYIAVAVAIFVLALSIVTMTQPKYEYTQANYQRAMSAENPNDKCATPAGYTDSQWREHMGHHPDQYAECLT